MAIKGLKPHPPKNCSTGDVILGEGVYGKIKVAHLMALNIPIAIKIGKNTSFSALSKAGMLQHQCQWPSLRF